MRANEIMTDIIGAKYIEEHRGETVDTLKFGDENVEVTKIATCLTITPDLIRDMKEWGAELVITHEPTFYNHIDEFHPDRLSLLKKKALEEAGFTVYRYHDSMHLRAEDEVNLSFISRLGWEGEFDGDYHITLTEGKTAREIAKEAGEALGIKHPRIVGNPDFKATHINLGTGARGNRHYSAFLNSDTDEVAICGELCEWEDCEPIRDAAQFGWKKAIVILGHAGSEKLAMEDFAKSIDKKYDGASVKYFDCGEIYTY